MKEADAEDLSWLLRLICSMMTPPTATPAPMGVLAVTAMMVLPSSPVKKEGDSWGRADLDEAGEGEISIQLPPV